MMHHEHSWVNVLGTGVVCAGGILQGDYSKDKQIIPRRLFEGGNSKETIARRRFQGDYSKEAISKETIPRRLFEQCLKWFEHVSISLV